MTPLDALHRDIATYDVDMSSDAWAAIRAQLSEARYKAKEVIFRQQDVANLWFFVSKGVAASEQLSPDGDVSIARFFEAGQFCANLTSTWRKELCNDDLIAITEVEGVMAPDALFRSEYLGDSGFSIYLRLKTIETLLFDKSLICAKTSMDTEIRYRFLEDHYSAVIANTSQKDIARFLGITPQGMSRFLKNRAQRT